MQLLNDDEVLALSEVCWCCGDGDPVAVASVPREGRVPVCERCLDAFREAGVANLPAFPKRCSCGRVYMSPEQWAALDYVGVQDDEVELIELRNCVCCSTIGIAIGASPTLAHADTIPAPPPVAA